MVFFLFQCSGSSEYNELCKHGSGVDGHGNDIDECRNNAGTTMGICSNGRCENLHKDYRCICNSGYKNSENSNKICEGICYLNYFYPNN